MQNVGKFGLGILCTAMLVLTSCSAFNPNTVDGGSYGGSYAYAAPDYASRLPPTVEPGEKVVMIDPNAHAWGAYDSSGNLVRAGVATAGSNWCPDLGRPCRTSAGQFRISSLGDAECKSRIFPKPKGGAPMPYCMFFNGGQAMHGSSEGEVVEANISHGCVRMHVADAEWIRFNFANVGTKVIVKPY